MSCLEGGDKLAGRQPAVKVGGMRIKAARHSTEDKSAKHAETTDEVKVVDEDDKEVVTSEAPPPSKSHQEYSSEGAKQKNYKPLPTHEKPVMNKQVNKTITQPR